MTFSKLPLGFTDPGSPFMEWILDMHQTIWYWLILIVISVFWMIYTTIARFTVREVKKQKSFEINKKFILAGNRLSHASLLEIVWTLIPIFILISIAIPSFILLYSIEEMNSEPVGATIKVIGNQWYWNYEIGNQLIESYLVDTNDLEIGALRLLETDNALILPLKVNIRLLITANDVLHCWAVPALGVKLDAVPGRLNETSVFIKRLGTFYGQCSEICGVNHGFMPIKIKVVDYQLLSEN